MRHPPMLSLIPNLFLELDVCISSMFSLSTVAQTLDEIIELFSQLSLATDHVGIL